jgi:hypothetical protein
VSKVTTAALVMVTPPVTARVRLPVKLTEALIVRVPANPLVEHDRVVDRDDRVIGRPGHAVGPVVRVAPLLFRPRSRWWSRRERSRRAAGHREDARGQRCLRRAKLVGRLPGGCGSSQGVRGPVERSAAHVAFWGACAVSLCAGPHHGPAAPGGEPRSEGQHDRNIPGAALVLLAEAHRADGRVWRAAVLVATARALGSPSRTNVDWRSGSDTPRAPRGWPRRASCLEEERLDQRPVQGRVLRRVGHRRAAPGAHAPPLVPRGSRRELCRRGILEEPSQAGHVESRGSSHLRRGRRRHRRCAGFRSRKSSAVVTV